MKRIIATLLILVMLTFILSACTDDDHAVHNIPTTTTQSNQEIPTGNSENQFVAASTITEPTEPNSTPYVPILLRLLDTSAAGYKNETGDTFFGPLEQGTLDNFYLKTSNQTKFYYTTSDTVIGIKDNDMSVVANVINEPVRDTIKKLNVPILFEVHPAVCEVNNSHNTNNFFYWKTSNGYIGFVTIGGNDPSVCYQYHAYAYIMFEDLSVINMVNTDNDSNSAQQTDAKMRIELAPNGCYNNTERFEIYHFEDLEYGDDVIFNPTSQLYNFKFFSIDGQKLIFNDECVITSTLFTKDKITPEKPFLTRIYNPNYSIPYFGISFTDEIGMEYKYYIRQSGFDGSYSLVPF